MRTAKVRGVIRSGKRAVSWVAALALLALAWVSAADAAVGSIVWKRNGVAIPDRIVPSNSCADVMRVVDAYEVALGTAFKAYACSSEPVVNGATIYTMGYPYTVSSISATGTSADGAAVLCVASAATVSPCPSGYAPWLGMTVTEGLLTSMGEYLVVGVLGLSFVAGFSRGLSKGS